MHAISIQGISKSYFNKPVLENISFDLEAGRFYALIGANGAGKSTLLRILRRIETPDKGDGTVSGFQLSNDDADFGLDVGYASESVALPFWTSVRAYFETVRSLYPRWDQKLLDQMTEQFGLDLDKNFGQLSRGQRMQALFLYCMAIRPKILILDEVTSVLDSRVRPLALDFCKKFAEGGGTIVMATNLVFEVQGFAHQGIYLSAHKAVVSALKEI
jgi:ABC-2 type transport system ATP-binding protein